MHYDIDKQLKEAEESQEEKVNLRHIQFPNSIEYSQVGPIDCLVYVAIKSFDGSHGCFPSVKSIAEFANLSPTTVKKSINNLKNKKIIEVSCAGKGQKTYYTFPRPLDLGFEPFSYEFAQDKNLPPSTKGCLIMAQKLMSKNSEDQAAIVDTTMSLAEKLNMSPKTLRSYERALQDEGILTIAESKLTDEGGGKKQIRYYNLSKYCQAIAYVLRNFNERITNTEVLSKLNSEQIAKLIDNYKELKQKNNAQNKTIEVLQRELTELKNQINKNQVITL